MKLKDVLDSLAGQLLIAMPGMPDPRFEHSVILMCAHSDDGAMGLVINQLVDTLGFAELLDEVGLEDVTIRREMPVHYGGPVESGLGFVLHSADYTQEGTMEVDERLSLTASVDLLREIAEGGGPRKCLLALGYSGWGPGQLENELQNNGWLHVPPDDDLIFDTVIEDKWQAAIAKIGIDLSMLSTDSGRA